MTRQDELTCVLLCIGVWHLKSCFLIAVIGWEMCKNQSVGFPVVYFLQAAHRVYLLIIIWWIRHGGTKGALFF